MVFMACCNTRHATVADTLNHVCEPTYTFTETELRDRIWDMFRNEQSLRMAGIPEFEIAAIVNSFINESENNRN